jgi:hypothetical protein
MVSLVHRVVLSSRAEAGVKVHVVEEARAVARLPGLAEARCGWVACLVVGDRSREDQDQTGARMGVPAGAGGGANLLSTTCTSDCPWVLICACHWSARIVCAYVELVEQRLGKDRGRHSRAWSRQYVAGVGAPVARRGLRAPRLLSTHFRSLSVVDKPAAPQSGRFDAHVVCGPRSGLAVVAAGAILPTASASACVFLDRWLSVAMRKLLGWPIGRCVCNDCAERLLQICWRRAGWHRGYRLRTTRDSTRLLAWSLAPTNPPMARNTLPLYTAPVSAARGLGRCLSRCQELDDGV